MFVVFLLVIAGSFGELSAANTKEPEYPLFETYHGYKDGEIGQRISDKFDKYIPLDGRDTLRILHIGAKTSDFAEKLYKDGFKYIDNIDLLEEKMKLMRNRMKQLNIPSDTVTFQAANMYEFGDINHYDIVIDKGVVELTHGAHNKYLPHCWNILKMNGLFITIGPFAPNGSKQNGWWLSSDMSPSNWKTDHKNGWKLVAVETIDNSYIRVPHPDKFYLYFIRKTEKNDQIINAKQEI